MELRRLNNVSRAAEVELSFMIQSFDARAINLSRAVSRRRSDCLPFLIFARAHNRSKFLTLPKREVSHLPRAPAAYATSAPVRCQ